MRHHSERSEDVLEWQYMRKTTGNAIYDIQYHFVWIPKYRKRVLTGQVSTRLAQLFSQCAEINQFEIMELAIQPDHVHLLVSAKPRYSPSDIAQYFKGGSSRIIREEFPGLEEFLWGDSFWADGYFVSTHSVVSESTIRNYIKKQDKDR
jgi:putative transposase